MTKTKLSPAHQKLHDEMNKLGQERWTAIIRLADVCSELTNDNNLEEVVVFLCREVIKRDEPFRKVCEKIKDDDTFPCGCPEEEESDD